jgi:hypothetical protein
VWKISSSFCGSPCPVPYGPGHLAGGDNRREIDPHEAAICRAWSRGWQKLGCGAKPPPLIDGLRAESATPRPKERATMA